MLKFTHLLIITIYRVLRLILQLTPDKNEYTLGVPYDRNFHYSVKVGNPYVSKLDDFEITLDLPLSAEGSDYTGFHTTGMLMSKNLIDSYKVLEYFTFYDASDPDTAYKFDFDKENGTFTAEDGTIYNVVDADGNISIDEKQSLQIGN